MMRGIRPPAIDLEEFTAFVPLDEKTLLKEPAPPRLFVERSGWDGHVVIHPIGIAELSIIAIGAKRRDYQSQPYAALAAVHAVQFEDPAFAVFQPLDKTLQHVGERRSIYRNASTFTGLRPVSMHLVHVGGRH
jgi:hypothetical protein